MKRIDVRGKSCPVPVIETRNLIESGNFDEVEVLVDNPTSKENVTRFLESRGYCVAVEEADGFISVRASGDPSARAAVSPATNKTVVFVDGETLGRGDPELGAILMKSFLHTLKELNPLPRSIIFINAGVNLAVEGSNYLGVLGELENLGIEITSCGTCLDFYRLKEKLAVGRVTNMYDIVTSLSEATAVLKP
jgi:selenium metabolism protein YedF